jgi:hypothetical protein
MSTWFDPPLPLAPVDLIPARHKRATRPWRLRRKPGAAGIAITVAASVAVIAVSVALAAPPWRTSGRPGTPAAPAAAPAAGPAVGPAEPSTTSPSQALPTQPATSQAPTAAPPVSPATEPDPAIEPSGQRMPVGDLPGWRQVFADDFATPVAIGDFPGRAYGGTWTVYDDGIKDSSERGVYYPSKVVSVKGGLLTVHVHTERGVHMGAAVLPKLLGSESGQRYGRYTIRFRADPVRGYQTTFIQWPDSDRWPTDGSIDWPAGNLDETISGYMHYTRASGGIDQVDSPVSMTGWHTATMEWTPGKVTFILDGQTVGMSRTDVPRVPLHPVLQTETCFDDGCTVSDSAVGDVQIDWIAVYAADPAP